MRKYLAFAAIVAAICFGLSTNVHAQSTVGTLTGTVSDNTEAKIPGVLIKVLNEDTGQSQSMLTNDSGLYSFIVSPGSNYTITAVLDGFKQVTVNKIILRIGDTSTVNIGLEVGEVINKIIVDATKADPLLKDPTIGITLGETEIMGLPLVGNDPLQLITTLPGYRANPLGHEYDTVGGLPMSMVNTVRDGLSVTDGFTPNGVGSTTIMNPDMISEIRLILSPVDAESGRGNGQVQITTKSGTNRFQWNVNYNLRQNAFNSLGPSPSRIKQPFAASFQYIVSVGGPIWKNHTFYFANWDQQLTYRRPYSQRTTCVAFTQCASGGFTVVPALTESAKDGVFRFFDGWNMSNTTTPVQTGSTLLTYPIDISGRAVAPQFWAGTTGEPYDGQLMCISVFGTRTRTKSTFGDADCGEYYLRKSDGTPDFDNPLQGKAVLPDLVDPFTNERNWDGHGRVPDRTGYIDRLLAYMPTANFFASGASYGGFVQSTGSDGLNRASAQYILEERGLANRNTFAGGTFGTGLALDNANVDHKTLNLKFDHNINAMNRITLSTSFQNDRNSRVGASSRWPDGVDGYVTRVPHILTLNGLSTLSSQMVNEARFGITFNRSAQLPPWSNPADQASADFARTFLQQGWLSPGSGEPTPIYYTPGIGGMDFNSNILPSGLNSSVQTQGVSGIVSGVSGCLNGSSVDSSSCEIGSALYNFADTFSWNVGRHAFRTGGEFRLTRAHEVLSQVIPSATAGTTTGNASRLNGTGATTYPADMQLQVPFNLVAGTRFTGLMDASRANARDLLYFLSGSVSSVSQQFWVNSVDNYRYGKWDTWDGNFCPEEGDLQKFCAGDGRQIRNTVQNEFAFFVKDDWKITKTLTLNLGVRYESYGNLYTRGFATGIVDAGYGLFGANRATVLSDPATYRQFGYGYNPFDTWLTPGDTYRTGYGTGNGGVQPAVVVSGYLPNGDCNYIPGLNSSTINDRNPDGTCASTVPTNSANGSGYFTTVACIYGVKQNAFVPESNCQPNLLTTRVFVGPDSKPHGDPDALDYSKQPSTYRDRNNIGPAIGFSWRPQIGSKTVLVRGGFQFTYGSAGRDRSFATGSASSLTNRSGGSNANTTIDQLNVSCGTATATCPGVATGMAFMLSDLPNITPLAPAADQVPTMGANTNGVLGSTGNVNPTGENLLSLQVLSNARGNNFVAYSPNYQDARTENYTFSVSTNLNRSSSVSVSYVGTLGRNRPTSVNLNMPNVFGRNKDGSWANPELLDALNDTRAGKDSPFFDQVLAGLNLTGLTATSGYGNIGTCVAFAGANPGITSGGPNSDYCGPGFVYQSGSAHLRRNATISRNLANGNYNAVLNSLTANPIFAGAVVPTGTTSNSTLFPQSFSGNLFRNGCDRLGTASLAGQSGRQFVRGTAAAGAGNTSGALGGNPDPVRCLPEDFVVTNNTIDQATYNDNWGYTNYHQLQTQYTLRMSTGISIQATYLTSKTLAAPRDFYRTSSYNFNANGAGGTGYAYAASAYAPGLTGFSNPQTEATRALDYAMSSDSLAHSVRLNAVLSLPIGPGRALLGKTRGIIGQLVGGWNLSVIYNAQSGTPFSISAGDMQYGVSSGTAVGGDDAGNGCNAYAGTVFSPNQLAGTGTSLNCQSGLSFPDVVSPLWTNPRGKLVVNGPNGETTYFGSPSPFAMIRDPQCTNGTLVGRNAFTDPGGFNLATNCNLLAMVMKVPEGTPGAFALGPALPTPTSDTTPVLIMLQNPQPGRNGTLGAQTMRQPGRFYLDASLSKSFMFTERRGVQLRVDATNVMNHPQPIDLYLSVGPGGSFNDQSSAQQRSLANGCFNQYTTGTNPQNASSLQNGLANCGRQVQVSFRMINN